MWATRLAKLMILVTLVFSLLFAGMALGLYANRINWPGSQGAAADKIEGEVDRLKNEVEEQGKAMARNRTVWEIARNGLFAEEKRMQADREWYADQLSLRETGVDRKGKEPNGAPVKSVEYEGGKAVLEKGRPKLKDEPDLKPLDELKAEIKTADEEIKATYDAVNRAKEDQKRLSEEIKVLRSVIGEEERVAKNSAAEVEDVERELYNREVESQMLLQRQRSLEARLKQLKGTGVAARRP